MTVGSADQTRTSRPKKIGKYEITGTLGRGAMGVVYKGLDPQIGRTVAVKTLRRLSDLEGSKRERVLERFKSEARSAGNLRHPNIITVFEANVEDQIPYIVMDHVQGESFDQVIARVGKLSPDATLFYLNQVALALDYAHRQGVIHRDIKPSNLVLNDEGQMFILDFGIARINDSFTEAQSKSKKEPVMGTPGYMSPEQILNKQLDNRSDLFSLAILTYECLTGKRPFSGKDYNQVVDNILHIEPPPLVNINGLNGEVQLVMNKALAKARELRYESASAFVTALQDAFAIRELSNPGNLNKNSVSSSEAINNNWNSLAAKAQLAEVLTNYSSAGDPTDQKKDSTKDNRPVSIAPVLKRNPNAERVMNSISTQTHTKNDSLAVLGNKLFIISAVVLLACFVSIAFIVIYGSGAQVSTNENPPVVTSNVVEQDDITTMINSGKLVTELDSEKLIETIKSSSSDEPLLLAALKEAERRNLSDLVSAAISAINHDSVNIRIETAKILGRTKNAEAVALLLPALDDYDPRVRVASAEALGIIGSNKALSYLSNSLAKEEVPAVIQVLQNTINKIQGFESKTQ